MPPGKTSSILDHLLQNKTEADELFCNAFWSKEPCDTNSVIVFPGEFKKAIGNRNQLVVDFGAAQHQRRALGLKDVVIWGATCAMGEFILYSSEWVGAVRSITSCTSRGLLLLRAFT